MTPKEKAKELLMSFNPYVNSWSTISKPHETPQCILEAGQRKGRARQCALIAVDEILNCHIWKFNSVEPYKYWQEVKQELQKL